MRVPGSKNVGLMDASSCQDTFSHLHVRVATIRESHLVQICSSDNAYSIFSLFFLIFPSTSRKQLLMYLCKNLCVKSKQMQLVVIVFVKTVYCYDISVYIIDPLLFNLCLAIQRLVATNRKV